MNIRLLGACLALTACAGCASAPIHYYSLVSEPQDPQSGTHRTCCDLTLRVAQLPAEVDRSEIVIRRSDGEVDILGDDVWIAPVRDEVRSALLNRIRGKDFNQNDPAPSPREIGIRVEVDRFEAQPGRYVLVDIGWRISVEGSPSARSLNCRTTARLEIGTGVPALVDGYQRAVAIVGDEIAAGITHLKEGGPSDCST